MMKICFFMFHCVNFDSINYRNHWWICVDNKNEYQYFILIANDSLTLSIYFSKNEPKSDRFCLIHSSVSEVLSSCQCHHSQLFDEFRVSDTSSTSNKFENFCYCVVCASKHLMVLFLIFSNLIYFISLGTTTKWYLVLPKRVLHSIEFYRVVL